MRVRCRVDATLLEHHAIAIRDHGPMLGGEDEPDALGGLGADVEREGRGLRGAFTHPRGVSEHEVQRLSRRRHLEGVVVGVHALWELDAEALDPFGHERGGEFEGALIACVVAVLAIGGVVGYVLADRFVECDVLVAGPRLLTASVVGLAGSPVPLA